MTAAGRSVVISGAARGIGEAMALAFARAGDRLVLLDSDPAGEGVARRIAASGGEAAFALLDVSDWAGAQAAVDEAAARYGAVDVCIANAGIAWRKPVLDMAEADWDRVIDVNLKGTAQLLRAAAGHMAPRGQGALIALSSTSARFGWAEHAHYNASKAGIEGLVRGLAAELGPAGVRVNAILPGVVRTAQSLSQEHSLGEAGLRRAAERIPLRRVGEPADIAGVALFLASDAARYVTGHSLIVDGGMSIGSY